ncbi:MAG: type II secretion system GspH family protein [Armatimonadetes bacterium]|nr:type II secretion system GspH family protein [Armatimonadota bacterium]
MTSPHRRGFTLLELLISIAIIGLLAGITFPLLARSRHKARATACINNLRQIGLALQMYASDWAGCAPPYTTATTDSYMIGRGEKPDFIEIAPFNDAAQLKRVFAPYGAGSDELWSCPLDPPYEIFGQETLNHWDETDYVVPPIFAVRRPLRLDDPPLLSQAAYERMGEEGQRPGLLYFVDGDDPPYYLACISAMVGGGDVPKPYTVPHGETYPVILLDGSVVHLRGEY